MSGPAEKAGSASPRGGAVAHEVSVDSNTSLVSPLVYVVVLNYNGADLTLNCVDSVLKIDYPNFRVVVVDNASADDSLARFKAALTDPRIEILANVANEGYAGGNNRGIEKALAAGADYIFILNNDTAADPGCLHSLVGAMERDGRIAIAGCPLTSERLGEPLRVDYRISLYTGRVGHWSDGGAPNRITDVDYVCGAAMLLRASALVQTGAFDPAFFLLSEDTDLCFRTRKAGYRVCYVPGPGARHMHSHTLNRYRPTQVYCATRNVAWLVRRHATPLQRALFTAICFGYVYPKAVLGRFARGEADLLLPLLRGIRDGHLSSPEHLAAGRPAASEASQANGLSQRSATGT